MKATQEGRQLVLTVDGLERPFRIDPLPAKRGKFLSEQFIQASVGLIPTGVAEQIFVEAIGLENYARMTGLRIDLRRVTEIVDGLAAQYGESILGVTDHGVVHDPDGLGFAGVSRLLTQGFVFVYTDDPDSDGEPIRQEEAEALCLAAFYWQSVVGIEAVEVFLEEGGKTAGSVKALALLVKRLGLSQSTNSSTEGSAPAIQEGSSSPESVTANSSALERLPANRRSFMKPRNRKPR